MEKEGLTDLVLPFHGELHYQLLRVGTDENKWRCRLFTGVGKLQGGDS